MNTPQPYAVYHATNIMTMLYPNPQDWLINREQRYQHVANVYTECGRVFALTNHTDGQNWTECSEVFWGAPQQSPRSTSVGDVIYSLSTHRAWMFTHDGLQEVMITPAATLVQPCKYCSEDAALANGFCAECNATAEEIDALWCDAAAMGPFVPRQDDTDPPDGENDLIGPFYF